MAVTASALSQPPQMPTDLLTHWNRYYKLMQVVSIHNHHEEGSKNAEVSNHHQRGVRLVKL